MFKPGDKVRCIDNINPRQKLIVNQIYTIKEVYRIGYENYVRLAEYHTDTLNDAPGFYEKRFKLVQDNTKYSNFLDKLNELVEDK